MWSFATLLARSEMLNETVSSIVSKSSDSIFNDITNIYDGKVGENYNEEQLEKIYQEGKRRYEQKIPPGYCDENDKKNRSKQEIFGDLIIWKQILDKSKSESKNIIFVSKNRYHNTSKPIF